MENVLQRNLGTDMAGDCIFRASGGPNFENCSTQCHGAFVVRCMYLHAQITSGYNTEMIHKSKSDWSFN